jgi:pimeloyl-ACP methyl ester carboxylesterase
MQYSHSRAALLFSLIFLLLFALAGLAPPRRCLGDELSDLREKDLYAYSPLGDFDGEKDFVVIVHGYNPNEGEYVPLGMEMAKRGKQVFFFKYNWRKRLKKSAGKLAEALKYLVRRYKKKRIIVIAHSMGGLIARRALTKDGPGELAKEPARFDLITVACPFGGFSSANGARYFGSGLLIALGIVKPCHRDLGTRAPFIKKPGTLAGNAVHYKLETKEKDKKRVYRGKLYDDDKLPLDNQRNDRVDEEAARVDTVEAGHAGVLYDDRKVNPKLLHFVDEVTGPPKPPKPERRQGIIHRLPR